MEHSLNRTIKRVKLKGKVNSVVREQYLRDDVPCHSPHCQKCSISVCKALYQEANHYAIPCFDAVQQFLEIFELPEIKGLVILQSIACKVLRVVGRGDYRRILNLSRDSRRGCTVFLNEVCEHTSYERLPNESEEKWLMMCCLKVAQYYSDHLNRVLPIILITENPELFAVENLSLNVQIMTMKSYLSTMWSDFKEALELYESITVASSALSNTKDSLHLYDRYLSPDVLENGVKGEQYIRGILRVNKHLSSHEAYVTSSVLYKKDFGDVLIFGMKDRNRAIHGDDVVVELLPRGEWKSKNACLINENEDVKEASATADRCSFMPTGKVVGILQRRWRDYVATLPEEKEDASSMSRSNTERLLVVPYDYRIPKIRIATTQAELLRNQRIVVRIDRWDRDSQYPNGHFVRTLGEIGILETEVKSLLVSHEISVGEFSSLLLEELSNYADEMPWAVSDDELFKRKDLRKSHLIFSIDPKGCEDVDDALSVRNLPDGNIELGVHIADVTHFVKPHSLIDLEACSRSTSVYLPDRRYDMLPHVLSGNLCSLLGNVDRYAVSVIWNLDPNYEVSAVWYGRTAICSSYKLCYEDAESILNDCNAEKMQEHIAELQSLSGDQLNQRFSELKNSVLGLVKIAKALRKKRLDAGGLELNNINMKFEIDKTLPSVVTNYLQVKELEVHKTVAECMIFANYWVAKQISQAFPQQAVMRRHPHPQCNNLQELQKLASLKGFTINIGSNKELAQSLHEACDQNDPSVNQIFRILATRAMNEAVYFCAGTLTPEDFYHYGLGITHYTHFTSPIRRYSDVMVHRLLLASVQGENEIGQLRTSEVESMCIHMNEKHRAAQQVEKAAQELFQAYFFREQAEKNSSECLADAVIYSLKANGTLVFIPLYGIKGAVRLLNKDRKVAVVHHGKVHWEDGSAELSETTLTIKSMGLVQKYSVFDRITVCIAVEKPRSHEPKIIIELIRNEPYEAFKSAKIRNSPSNVHNVQMAACELLKAVMFQKNAIRSSACHKLFSVLHASKAKGSLCFFWRHELKNSLMNENSNVSLASIGGLLWVKSLVEDMGSTLTIKSQNLVKLCSGFDGIMVCAIGHKPESEETAQDTPDLCSLCKLMRAQYYDSKEFTVQNRSCNRRKPGEMSSTDVHQSIKTDGVLVFIPCHGIKNEFGWLTKSKNRTKNGTVKQITKSDAVHWMNGTIDTNTSSLVVNSPSFMKELSQFYNPLLCVVILKPKSNQVDDVSELPEDEPCISEVVAESQSDHTELLNNEEVAESWDDAPPTSDLSEKTIDVDNQSSSLYHLLQNFRKMTLLPPPNYCP